MIFSTSTQQRGAQSAFSCAATSSVSLCAIDNNAAEEDRVAEAAAVAMAWGLLEKEEDEEEVNVPVHDAGLSESSMPSHGEGFWQLYMMQCSSAARTRERGHQKRDEEVSAPRQTMKLAAAALHENVLAAAQVERIMERGRREHWAAKIDTTLARRGMGRVGLEGGVHRRPSPLGRHTTQIGTCYLGYGRRSMMPNPRQQRPWQQRGVDVGRPTVEVVSFNFCHFRCAPFVDGCLNFNDASSIYKCLLYAGGYSCDPLVVHADTSVPQIW
jgi:hypothetical protein